MIFGFHFKILTKRIYFLLLCSILTIRAQEVTPPDHIKSIIFQPQDRFEEQIPILRMGESLQLEFDDLNADEADYYYTITHCDYHWNPSDMTKSEYLTGFDEQRITELTNSYGTLQPYTNYRLRLPNENTSWNISGNYLLSILDNDGNVVFTRRFVVYTDQVEVAMQIRRSKELQTQWEHYQEVSFKVRDKNHLLENPQTSVQVAVLQNYRWATLQTGITPRYILSDELVYENFSDKKTLSFEAGNEYFYFENKEIRSTSNGIRSVALEQLYHCYLTENYLRNSSVYTYNPDIDGNFLISTRSGEASIESDYAWVHFRLSVTQPEFWNRQIYVYGKFSNNELTDLYRLTFHPEGNFYEGKVLLKQGFYNYKFAVKNGNRADFNILGGNFYQTENQYTVLVYYRPVGGLYDQVIGVGSLQSVNISL